MYSNFIISNVPVKKNHTLNEVNQTLYVHLNEVLYSRIAILKLGSFTLEFILSLSNIFLCIYPPPKNEKSMSELKLEGQ